MKVRFSSSVKNSFCAALAVCALTASAAPDVLVTVNGKPIAKTMLDVLVIDQGLQGKPQEAEFRAYAKGELIQREIMAQQAQALKLDKTPAHQAKLREMQQAVQKQFDKASKEQRDARIAFNAQGMLAQSFFDDFEKKHKPVDADMRAAYQHIVQSKGGTEYKVRHIQLTSEAAAKAVIAKLGSGAKFETLVVESQDLGSKDEGGDLGWLKAEGFPASFADAVRKLAAGGFTREPVKVEEGYHVIWVEGARELPVGSYESYADEIRDGMKQRALSNEIESLMKKAKIKG